MYICLDCENEFDEQTYSELFVQAGLYRRRIQCPHCRGGDIEPLNKSYTVRVRATYETHFEITANSSDSAKALAMAEAVDTPIEDYVMFDWSTDIICIDEVK